MGCPFSNATTTTVDDFPKNASGCAHAHTCGKSIPNWFHTWILIRADEFDVWLTLRISIVERLVMRPSCLMAAAMVVVVVVALQPGVVEQAGRLSAFIEFKVEYTLALFSFSYSYLQECLWWLRGSESPRACSLTVSSES